MLKKILLCLFGILFLTSVATQAITLDFKGFIADEAKLLSDDVKNDLNVTLWNLQQKSGADLAVVTLPSLSGRKIEDVALEIGRSYKLGAVGKNNGMVFLTAPNERLMRIELGLGLEDKISIETLEYIRDNDILPYYKKGNYEAGIARGTYILAHEIARAEGVSLDAQGNCPPRNNSASKEDVPIWVYLLAILLAGLKRRRMFDSGSFGGFGGGGGFGGSGCSGSW